MPKTKKKTGETEIPREPAELSWRAAEYDFYEKGLNWYLLIGAFSLLLVVVAIWQNDFFFAIFILIAAAMVLVLGGRRPGIIELRLTKEGCHLGEKFFYPYDSLENFSIEERPGRLNAMVLKKKSAFNPYVRALLDTQTAEKAREFLKEKLPEVTREDSFVDIFTHFLGF